MYISTVACNQTCPMYFCSRSTWHPHALLLLIANSDDSSKGLKCLLIAALSDHGLSLLSYLLLVRMLI